MYPGLSLDPPAKAGFELLICFSLPCAWITGMSHQPYFTPFMFCFETGYQLNFQDQP